ncbi:MAG: protein translocase subunit SecD [Deltaproteobacteria bacterium]|nr:MAG: protein translocase subunit SecD [Deltaproteobacteria bacterium]
MKDLRWRALLVLAVFAIALIYLLPTLSKEMPPWWTKVFPDKKIHLGLDLQGGMHLTLEVEHAKAVENTAERLAQEIKDELGSAHIRFRLVERQGKDGLRILLPREQDWQPVADLLKNKFPLLEVSDRTLTQDQLQFLLKIEDSQVRHIKKLAVDQGLETIRNRIDQFGVSEPDIRTQGENRILIQLPGIKDPQRAIDLIGKTALLEFKLVDEARSVQEALKGNVPPGDKVYYSRQVDPVTGQVSRTAYLLKDRTLLTGEFLTNAEVRIDSQFNRPYVALSFDDRGGKLFERITGENVKKRLAIVLDGNVYSAPVIQDRISGGNAIIEGQFTMEEAKDLAVVLRAGSLPAPVKILEERTVGPSLGKDSIRKGLLSMAVGGVLVVAFMVIYYGASGIIADLALVLNIVLIMAGLAAFGATLTLPGIAGIILTIGMAVDANVLIFERIREELRLGKTPRAALDSGYSKATITILDANVTTLIAAVVLLQFGTGPVRGFAITLSLGIAASMFTAIFGSRLLFDYLLQKKRMKKLSI